MVSTKVPSLSCLHLGREDILFCGLPEVLLFYRLDFDLKSLELIFMKCRGQDSNFPY